MTNPFVRLLRLSLLALAISGACRPTQAATYSYDSLNRLSGVVYPDGTTVMYTYDAASNRLSQVISNPSVALPSISVDKNALTFSVAAGQATPAQIVAVKNGGGGNLQWDAVTSASWLSVTPGSGTNSGAVNVTASAAGLSAGTYNASVMILASASNTPLTIPVIFTVAVAQSNPTIMNGGIVSAAGASSAIARGSIASIYGNSLADGPALAATLPLPRTLGNVQVSVNGINAPLFYTNSKQINFQVPFEAPLQGQASIVVTRDGVASLPTTVALAPYVPAVFTYERVAAVFDPVIVHAVNNQLVTPASPAVPGEYLIVYGTGLGDLSVLPTTGSPSPQNPPATANVTPTVTIGGVNAKVQFAGLTPGAVGLAQFNVQVPNILPTGATLPLVINLNNASSSPVNLWTASPVASNDYIIQTFAGDGVAGYTGDHGPSRSAEINNPYGVTIDALGNIYIADYANARVRKVTGDGTITTVAGNGTAGYSGDNGPATEAQLSAVYGVTVDLAGNLYIADGNNARVRKVSTNGTITTVAGNGQIGYSGDGGPALAAQLGSVTGVVVDALGNLYIAEPVNARIRRVRTDGTITTFAGNGLPGFSGDGGPATSANLYFPSSIAVDRAGNIYITDASSAHIRKVTHDGIIATIAGSSIGFSGDGGLAMSADLAFPSGVAVDALGNLYIADTDNHRIRRITVDGLITTLAGTGASAYSGDGGPAVSAELNFPYGVAVDATGRVFVADSLNNRIRVLNPH